MYFKIIEKQLTEAISQNMKDYNEYMSYFDDDKLIKRFIKNKRYDQLLGKYKPQINQILQHLQDDKTSEILKVKETLFNEFKLVEVIIKLLIYLTIKDKHNKYIKKVNKNKYIKTGKIKYIKTNITMQFNDKTHYRIKRLSDGLIGGWILDYYNLSQDDNCFIYGNAVVTGEAIVNCDAEIRGNAVISDTARVTNNAVVKDNAVIYGHAHICNDAVVQDNSIVKDKAYISEKVIISGDSTISGTAVICGEGEKT